jgi:hypothetical protein
VCYDPSLKEISMPVRSIAVLSLILLAAFPVPAMARDAFAGAWKIEVTPDEDSRSAGSKEFKDTLTFKGNQVTSTTLAAKGFAAMLYEEDTRGGIVATFKAEGKSKKGEGAVVWTGTSSGGQIKGELTWTKDDGKVLKYEFTGERK